MTRLCSLFLALDRDAFGPHNEPQTEHATSSCFNTA
jgi:hypothetical protein